MKGNIKITSPFHSTLPLRLFSKTVRSNGNFHVAWHPRDQLSSKPPEIELSACVIGPLSFPDLFTETFQASPVIGALSFELPFRPFSTKGMQTLQLYYIEQRSQHQVPMMSRDLPFEKSL